MLGYDFTYSNGHPSHQGPITVDNYKLIFVPQWFECDTAIWSLLDYPCTDVRTYRR